MEDEKIVILASEFVKIKDGMSIIRVYAQVDTSDDIPDPAPDNWASGSRLKVVNEGKYLTVNNAREWVES